MNVPSLLQILVRGLRKVALLSIARIKEIAVHVKREDVKWVYRPRLSWYVTAVYCCPGRWMIY